MVILPSLKRQVYILIILLLLAILGLSSAAPALVNAQVTNNQPDPVLVETILNAMTPRERVGQLFMVSFKGSDVGSTSAIAEFIQRYRVGGVYISAENENFSNASNTPVQVLYLTNNLQALAQTTPPPITATLAVTPTPPITPTLAVTSTPSLTATLAVTATPTLTPPPLPPPEATYAPLPLFIATNHEGDGYPYTEIRGNLIDIPNEMALGATWNTENARLAGEVIGRNLSLLGVNMLLGPSLDVLDNPRPERGGSLGTRTFGGHPFWVSKMGQAYIR